MAGKAVRWTVVTLLVVVGGMLAPHARADIASASATNVQEGDNSSETSQSGEATSGDAVAGQVVGVVSSGDTSVDATNDSDGASAESGSASGGNSSASFVGLDAGTATTIVADIGSLAATNVQEGDNSLELTQVSNSVAGDAVAGQVIGVVTTGGATTDIVAADTCSCSASSGGADSFNSAASFVGLSTGTASVIGVADIASASATNVQEGDNSLEASQTATATDGDAVAGQVLGVVSSGDTSIDATNDSSGSADSGGAEAFNSLAAFTGLQAGTGTAIASDVLSVAAANVQEGDNSDEVDQAASAVAGDAVSGQVAGVVTSSGGSADLVLANTSSSSAETGFASFENFDSSFTGLNASGLIDIF